MTDQAKTLMSDHVASFWRLLRTEHVRILIDIRRDHDEGQPPHWDSSSFGDDVAKALVMDADRRDGNVQPGLPTDQPAASASFEATAPLSRRAVNDAIAEVRKRAPARFHEIVGGWLTYYAGFDLTAFAMDLIAALSTHQPKQRKAEREALIDECRRYDNSFPTAGLMGRVIACLEGSSNG